MSFALYKTDISLTPKPIIVRHSAYLMATLYITNSYFGNHYYFKIIYSTLYTVYSQVLICTHSTSSRIRTHNILHCPNCTHTFSDLYSRLPTYHAFSAMYPRAFSDLNLLFYLLYLQGVKKVRRHYFKRHTVLNKAFTFHKHCYFRKSVMQDIIDRTLFYIKLIRELITWCNMGPLHRD